MPPSATSAWDGDVGTGFWWWEWRTRGECHGCHHGDTGVARAVLSVGRSARSPGGASRPPCLAQATARSPSLPDAALAPAGIQQPSPAGAPRCLPITHERCRADSSRGGRELPETPTGPRRPHAFASRLPRPQKPPHRRAQQGAAPGLLLPCSFTSSAHPHTSAPA